MALQRREATNVPKTDNDFEELPWGNLEAGDHEGRLVFVADLGLQVKEYKKEYKGEYQQISLGIEIVGQYVENEDGDEIPRILTTKPFYIYSTMGEKSVEWKFYSMFEPKAVVDSVPDWEAQLGKPISVTVKNVAGKGDNKDKIYDNIDNLSKIPVKYQDDVEDALFEFGIGDADDPENRITKGLFGLAKYVLDKRIKPEVGEEEEEAPKPKKAAKKKVTSSKKKPAAKKKATSRKKKVDDEDLDVPY